MNRQEKVLHEIRRQAIIRADQCRREEDLTQETSYTLDALQELTGLSRRELDAIAANVKVCYHPEEREFFSVKNQLWMVCSSLVLIGSLVWFLIRMIF